MLSTALNVALGVLSSLTVGLLLAVLTGKLVPSSKVHDQAKETEKWKASYEELKASADHNHRMLERLVFSADVTDKVMAAVRKEFGEGS